MEGSTTTKPVYKFSQRGICRVEYMDGAFYFFGHKADKLPIIVQPRDMADAGPALAEELIAYCKQHLSALKCPRTVDFEAELPRHPTGKLYKRLLRDRYWGDRKTRIV